MSRRSHHINGIIQVYSFVSDFSCSAECLIGSLVWLVYQSLIQSYLSEYYIDIVFFSPFPVDCQFLAIINKAFMKVFVQGFYFSWINTWKKNCWFIGKVYI